MEWDPHISFMLENKAHFVEFLMGSGASVLDFFVLIRSLIVSFCFACGL